jgi:hypothetical protein
MATDIFTANLDSLKNDQLFELIERFAEAQPVEGWRHDYSESWTDSALKNVAGFANTFGGVLIVGIKKGAKDAACVLVGVESETEYKTRIASSIAANIAPVPAYDVFECSRPDAANKKFCIVRVRNDNRLYMITKKGFPPVFLRNEDETITANAERLRTLVDKERNAATIVQVTHHRAEQIRDGMVIGSNYQDTSTDNWYRSPRQQPTTFLKLQLIANDIIPFELTKTHEDMLWRLISTFYQRFYRNVRDGTSLEADERNIDYYDRRTYQKNLDYETRWRITGTGDTGFATQVKWSHSGQHYWSVVDVCRYLAIFIRMSMKWWEFLNYFGSGNIYVQLNLDGLKILRHPEIKSFVYAVDPTWAPGPQLSHPDIRNDAILVGDSPRNSGRAEAAVDYFSATSELGDVVGTLVNKVLRSLGHAADTELLRDSLNQVIAP